MVSPSDDRTHLISPELPFLGLSALYRRWRGLLWKSESRQVCLCSENCSTRASWLCSCAQYFAVPRAWKSSTNGVPDRVRKETVRNSCGCDSRRQIARGHEWCGGWAFVVPDESAHFSYSKHATRNRSPGIKHVLIFPWASTDVWGEEWIFLPSWCEEGGMEWLRESSQ